jgi:DNA-binding MarR family transcriptional regulator
MAGPKPSTPAEDLHRAEYEALAGFRYEFRKFLSFSKKAAGDAGLRPQQYQALLAIKAHERSQGMAVKDLAAELLIGQSTAVELVDRLEDMGLIVRTGSSEDARVTLATLTERANQVLGNLAAVHRDELRRQIPALIALLSRLQDDQRHSPL